MDSRAALILALALVASCGENGAVRGEGRPAALPAAGATAATSPVTVRDSAPRADSTVVPSDSDDAPGSDGSDSAGDAAAAGDSGRALVLPRDTLPTMLPDDSIAGPRLVGTGAERRLLLPPRLMDVLRAQQPGFETMRRADLAPDSRDLVAGSDDRRVAPFAVIGDFDGDRRPDVAMFGHAGPHRRIVVILDRRGGPRVMSMAEDYGAEPDSLGVHAQLGLATPGETMFKDEADHPIRLTHDAIEVESEGAYELWYYANGQFLYSAIGD